MATEKLVHLNQRIPESLKKDIKAEADIRGLKLEFVVTSALRAWLEGAKAGVAR